MTFSNYSCHVTPLNKNLNVLKLNYIYGIELAEIMHRLHHGVLHKISGVPTQNGAHGKVSLCAPFQ